MPYCWYDACKHISEEFEIQQFTNPKWIWTCSLLNGGHFCRPPFVYPREPMFVSPPPPSQTDIRVNCPDAHVCTVLFSLKETMFMWPRLLLWIDGLIWMVTYQHCFWWFHESAVSKKRNNCTTLLKEINIAHESVSETLSLRVRERKKKSERERQTYRTRRRQTD